MPANSMDELVSLCKRRGFIFQSGEIYGGLQGIYDYGPMGVELKKNIKDSWWSSMVYKRDDVEGLDASILTNPKVLKYSGHEDTFSDPLVDCKDCNNRMRADHLKDSKCLHCGSTNLTEPRPFNLMFKTAIGPIDDGSSFAYLRPETAQQIFDKNPSILIEKAIKGMLPKNKLGAAIFRNLRVYNDDLHNQEAQNPEMIDLKDL